MRQVAGVPRVPPGMIPRPRLLAVLQRGRPLTVVQGAGGLGKTTLLAQWVAGLPEDEAVVWLTLDPTVQTRSGFWVRVLGALHRSGVVGDAELYRESAAIADDGDHAGSALGRVLPEAGRVVLVLDDFGGPQPFWEEACRDLVGLLRQHPVLRCVVAGSAATPLEGLLEELPTEVIPAELLALTPGEAEALATSSGATPGDAAVLSEDPPGSVRDLRLTLDLLERTGSRPATAARITSLAGPSADGGELAARWRDPRLRDTVAALSLAPYLDERLAAELAPGQDPSRLLQRLVRDGLGHWVDADDGRPVFRLSEQVRSTASAHLSAHHPETAPAILSQVARWLALERRDAAGSVEYALRAGDLDLADRVMMWAYPLPQEDHRHLGGLLEAMPAARFADRPFLALAYALHLNAEGRRARAAEYFAAAAEASRPRTARATAADRVVIHGLQTASYRMLGRRRRMVEAARWALRGLPDARSEPVDPHHGQALAVAVGQAATSLFSAEELDAAAAGFDDLAALAAEHGWGHFGNVAASGTALVAALQGRLADARSALSRVRADAWPEPWYRGYSGALRVLAQAWVHLDAGEPRAALAELEILQPHAPTLEYWDLLGTARAMAQAMLGQAASAELELGHLRRERETGATLPAMLVRVSVVQGILQLAEGRAADPPGPATAGPSRRALRAIAAAARGERERAVTLLARAEASAGTPVQEEFTVIAGAVLAHRSSPELSLVAKARRLATLVQGSGLRWPLVLLTEGDRARVLAELAGDGDDEAHGLLAASFAVVPALVTEALWQGDQVPALTPREREVLVALAHTGRRAEIAQRLFVSPNTVKAQLRTLYAKLAVGSREEALARAINLRLLQPPVGTGP